MSEINRVMRAVARGYRTSKAIAKASGISQVKTQTYLTRLIHRKLVESSKSPDPEERSRHIKHYHMKGIRIFLLQKVWVQKRSGGGSSKTSMK